MTLFTGCASQPAFVVQESSQGTALTPEQAEQFQAAVNVALETLPSGEIYRWRGEPDYAGTVTPLRTFRLETSGQYCREFESTVHDGLSDERIGEGRYIACRVGKRDWPVCGQPRSECS